MDSGLPDNVVILDSKFSMIFDFFINNKMTSKIIIIKYKIILIIIHVIKVYEN